MASTTARDLSAHRERRARGIPTLTALCGPVEWGWLAWEAFSGGLGLTALQSDATDAAGVVQGALGASWPSLRERALQRAAQLAGVSVAGAGRAALQGGRDLGAILDQLGSGREAALCRAAIEGPDEERARRLAALPPVDALGAAASLQVPLPAIFLRAGEAALATAGELAAGVPSLHLAVGLPDERVLHSPPDTRAKALAREGLVALTLEPLDLPAAQRALEAAGVTRCASSLQRLARDGASPELLDAFVRAALAPGARSAQESFLFLRLSSLPATAGLFELNGRVPLQSREAEVDLVCRRLKLAIEIDGYHHFRGADDYRRDRRKDLELQQAGYLVLRFLADDVVARLEAILDDALHAVERQRERLRELA